MGVRSVFGKHFILTVLGFVNLHLGFFVDFVHGIVVHTLDANGFLRGGQPDFAVEQGVRQFGVGELGVGVRRICRVQFVVVFLTVVVIVIQHGILIDDFHFGGTFGGGGGANSGGRHKLDRNGVVDGFANGFVNRFTSQLGTIVFGFGHKCHLENILMGLLSLLFLY